MPSDAIDRVLRGFKRSSRNVPAAAVLVLLTVLPAARAPAIVVATSSLTLEFQEDDFPTPPAAASWPRSISRATATTRSKAS